MYLFQPSSFAYTLKFGKQIFTNIIRLSTYVIRNVTRYFSQHLLSLNYQRLLPLFAVILLINIRVLWEEYTLRDSTERYNDAAKQVWYDWNGQEKGKGKGWDSDKNSDQQSSDFIANSGAYT